MYFSAVKWVIILLQEGLDEEEDEAAIKLEI